MIARFHWFCGDCTEFELRGSSWVKLVIWYWISWIGVNFVGDMVFLALATCSFDLFC